MEKDAYFLLLQQPFRKVDPPPVGYLGLVNQAAHNIFSKPCRTCLQRLLLISLLNC